MGDKLSFGEIVGKKINQLNLTMSELARRVDVDIGYISKIVNNKTINPSYKVVVRIANAVGIDINTINEVFDIEDNSSNTIIDSESQNLSFDDKIIIKNIMNEVINSSNSSGMNIKSICSILENIDRLQSAKKQNNDMYYMITFVDRDETKVLETPFMTDELRRLYYNISDCDITNSFIINGSINSIPANANITTIKDIIDTANSLGADDELYEDYIEIRDYIQTYMS